MPHTATTRAISDSNLRSRKGVPNKRTKEMAERLDKLEKEHGCLIKALVLLGMDKQQDGGVRVRALDTALSYCRAKPKAVEITLDDGLREGFGLNIQRPLALAPDEQQVLAAYRRQRDGDQAGVMTPTPANGAPSLEDMLS